MCVCIVCLCIFVGAYVYLSVCLYVCAAVCLCVCVCVCACVIAYYSIHDQVDQYRRIKRHIWPLQEGIMGNWSECHQGKKRKIDFFFFQKFVKTCFFTFLMYFN